MSDWPYYESHKVVQAAEIVRVDRPPGGPIPITVDPGTGRAEQFQPTIAGMAESAVIGGYAMLYPDGFRSISPAKAFKEGYTRCPSPPL